MLGNLSSVPGSGAAEPAASVVEWWVVTSFVVSQFRLARLKAIHLGDALGGALPCSIGSPRWVAISKCVGCESCRPRELVYTASFDKQGQCLAGMPWKTSRKTVLMLIRSNAVAVVLHGG